jgi:L-ribulose-5-phosphate 3-epimerase
VKLDATEADMTAIRRHADSLGIALTSMASGVGWEYSLSSPEPAMRNKGKDAVAKLLQLAKWLGVDTLLTVPGGVVPDVSYDAALENAYDAIQDLVPVAERLGVCIAIENVWNKFLLSPVEMRDFIDQFQSAQVGAYFDTGNIVAYGYPEHWIRILGERIRMVHAKDFRASMGNMDGFVMLLEGSVDWPAVMAAFREVGYDKALVAEYGSYAHSLDAMLKHVRTSLETILGF